MLRRVNGIAGETGLGMRIAIRGGAHVPTESLPGANIASSGSLVRPSLRAISAALLLGTSVTTACREASTEYPFGRWCSVAGLLSLNSIPSINLCSPMKRFVAQEFA